MNPLDMLNPNYNPAQAMFDSLQPEALRNLQAGQQQPSAIPLLQPQEEQSVLGSLSNAGMGALHYVGSALDKGFGGRAIRGVLGGHPEELASAIPFSDTLGLSDEKNRVSGEDLLKNAGVLGERDPDQGWLQARDLAGPAVEMALDPATYLTLGTGSALTEAGQAAKRAGTLADSAAGRIAAGQSGLVGLGLPFSKPSVILGTGATGQKIGGLIDQGVNKLAYSGPGRAFSRLFDSRVGDTASALGQTEARAASAQMPAALATARGRFLDVGNPLLAAGMMEPDTAADTGKALRAVLEGNALPLPNTMQGQTLEQAATTMRGHNADMLAAAQAQGRPINELAEGADKFAHRALTPMENPTKGYGRSGGANFPISVPGQKSRLDAFRDVPGGTNAINAASVDANISGPDRLILNAHDYIRDNYLGGTPGEEQELAALRSNPLAQPPDRVQVPDPNNPGKFISMPGTPSPEHLRLQELAGRSEKAQDWAEIMAGMDPKRAADNLPLFANHVLADFGKYAMDDARASVMTDARHNMLVAGANPAAGASTTAGDALEQLGLHRSTIVPGQANISGVNYLMEKLKAAGKLPANAVDMQGTRFSADAVADAGRYGNGFQVPDALRPVTNAIDSVTNLNKAWMSSFWPSTQARNLLTGAWQNMGEGLGIGDYAAADAMRQGKTVAGAAERYFPGKGLTDEAATAELQNLRFLHGGGALRGSPAEDAVGLGTHETPGDVTLPNSAQAAEKGLLATANPLNALPKDPKSLLDPRNLWDVRGVGGRTETGNSLIHYGQHTADAVDELNHTGAWLSALHQGYDPAAAMALATKAQYNYSNLSGFENQVMRRLMPWYNWSRQNIPYQVQHLMQHPGGLNAAAIKGTDDLRQKEGFVPDYIAEGTQVPVGKESGGTQRFLTDLGLPYEDLGDMASGGPNPLARQMEKYLGQLNPLIKAPLEYATGKQFYSDRDLADLHGLAPTGNSAVDTAVNQTVMNSPLQRLYGAYHTITDERKDLGSKALNLLSPAKITDVDMEKQRGIAARDQIDDALKGNPNVKHFDEMYVKKEDVQNLSPQDLSLMRLYKTLEAAAAKKAKGK